jgi:hypothetical protein
VSVRLAEALGYVERGWRVLPLDAKRPIVELAPRGLNNATSDPELVQRWWYTAPDANIGLACQASGLLVIDVDPRHGGHDTLHEIERELGALPETPRSVTGGGGAHYLFRDPGRVPGTLGDGVDLKRRGYVVAPRSVHPNGRKYEWDIAPDDAPLAELPPAWIKRLRPRAKVDRRYLTDEQIPEGRRHSELIRLAGHLRWVGLGPAGLESVLHAANATRCRPPLPRKDIEAMLMQAERWETWPLWQRVHSHHRYIQIVAPDLPSAQRNVLSALLDRASHYDGSGYTGDWLTRETGLSNKTIVDATLELEDRGLIELKRRPGRASVYSIASIYGEPGVVGANN